jgi:tetratricopeptide (TPR) repeat protein
MPNRRLNKKAAIIGSFIFAALALGAILVISQLSADSQEYIRDAESALQAARQAADEQIKQKNYDLAEKCFRGAYARAKTDSLREEILFKMVDMYLEVEEKEWPFILGCWDEIISINPQNAEARFGKLKYFYMLADSSSSGPWQEVHKQASQFLEVAKDEGLLTKTTAEWDVFDAEQQSSGSGRLGAYLYLVKGRAALELASVGAVTDPEESIAEAVGDLKKVFEYEPDYIDAYWYLAMATITKGEISASVGGFEERDKATEQAKAILEQAVQNCPDNPRAYINLLSLKLMLAQRSEPDEQKEQIASLEPEYSSLVRKFSSSAEAFAARSKFYSIYSIFTGPRLGLEKLDKAIEAVERAVKLDGQNVVYAISAANLYYRKYSLYNQESSLHKAIETAKNALALPGAQDSSGPRHQANKINRFMVYAFLANCYIEQILEPAEPHSAQQRAALLKDAEHAVNQVRQILGNEEELLVIKWKGMLELARGNRQAAVRSLYTAYEKFKALKPPEPASWQRDNEFAQLSYTLAKLYKDTPEIGAVSEFLESALYSGISELKPEAHLDYIEVLLRYGNWSVAIQNLNDFEDNFGSNERSRRLRIRSYIGAMQFDKAEEGLARLSEDDPNKVKLRLALVKAKTRRAQQNMAAQQGSESSDLLTGQTKTEEEQPSHLKTDTDATAASLENYRRIEVQLLQELLRAEPNSVGPNSLVDVCRYYISQGCANDVEMLVNKFLEQFPDNATVLVYKQMLLELEPANISQPRRREIEEQVLSNLGDPVHRSTQLGIFYRRYNELEKAAGQLAMAVEIGTSQHDVNDSPASEYVQIAASHLLDIALNTQDWELAQQVADTASRENLDGCGGRIFATRLAMARGQFDNALKTVNECLEQNPVFSHAFMLRSEINAALGNEHASVQDIRKAASLNPLDGIIAKALASVLYRRNQRLGDSVSSEQIIEVRSALENAVTLNPGDLSLMSLYAEYIAPTEPMRAIAIRQDLQNAAPNMENTLLLGQLATQVAVNQTDSERREAMFDIASSAFEQAREIDPNDKRMLYYYAEYFRARGQDDRAAALLQESNEQNLLWDHYFQLGSYDDARRVLNQLYEAGERTATVLRGLLLVAEKAGEKEAVKKYSNELIEAENTPENNLVQVEAFLRVGLIREAEFKLQSFKEKHPNDRRILLLEGWLLMRQGHLQKALQLVNKNLQENRNNPLAWRLRGEIHLSLNNYDRAISDLRESKRLLDGPATRISLARAYAAADRYEDAVTELEATSDKNYLSDAVAVYESLLDKMPNNTVVLNDLAYFLAENNERLPDALRYARRALDEQPNNPGYLDTYAYVLHKQGKDLEAGEYVNESLQQYRQKNIDAPAAVYEHKGLIEETLGQKDDALAAYRQALESAQGQLSEESRQRINMAIERLSR